MPVNFRSPPHALCCSLRSTSSVNKNQILRASHLRRGALKLWSGLPPSIRDTTLTMNQYCSRLKTHLVWPRVPSTHSGFGPLARTRDCLSPNSIRSILSYDLSYDLSETGSQTSRRPGLPTFFRQKKSETRSPTFFCSKLVCDQVPDFFICRKLAARSISTCRDRSILLETRFPTFFLLKTCRKPGFKQVLSKIDVMEFGH